MRTSLIAAIAREVGATAIARLDYAAVVDDATFLPIDVLEPGTPVRALVAARFPSARLIDNIVLPSPATLGRLMAEPLPTLDRVVVMPIVMQAMLDEDVRPHGDPDEVGTGHVVLRSRWGARGPAGREGGVRQARRSMPGDRR